ncbi:MAG: hypothetical protein KDA75_08950 [Planctomycetaceae bacterium]|nr:hypothetical protein [Planctomycetaceae bacterium]
MRSLALVLTLQLCGCYTLHDCVNQSLIDVRDHCEAHAVWKSCGKDQAACEEYPCNFGEGFREGYRAVSAGGNGCPPTLPPRKYWCVLYQNDEGRQKVVSWYNGYAAGAAAAHGNGVQERNRLVTATDLYHRQCPECRTEIVIDPPGPTEPELNEKSDYFPELPDSVPELPPIDPEEQAPFSGEAASSTQAPRPDNDTKDAADFVAPTPFSAPLKTPQLAPVPVSQLPPKLTTVPPGGRPLAILLPKPGAPVSVTSPKSAAVAIVPKSPVSLQVTDQYQVVKISDQPASGFVHIPCLEGRRPSPDTVDSDTSSPAGEFDKKSAEAHRPPHLAMSAP